MLIDARAKFLARAVAHGYVGGNRVATAVATGHGVLRDASPAERACFAEQLFAVLHLRQRGVSL